MLAHQLRTVTRHLKLLTIASDRGAVLPACVRHLTTNRIDVRPKHIADNVRDWLNTLNDVDARKVRYIQNEIYLSALQDADSAPSLDLMTIGDYQKLLTLTNNQRKRYYKYLYKNQFVTKDNKLERYIARSVHLDNVGTAPAERPPTQQEKRPEHLQYGLGKNTLLLRYCNQTIVQWKHKRLFHEMMFDRQQLIFDCGFENEMTYDEISRTAETISQCFDRNRDHRSPFCMHLYNLNAHGALRRSLSRLIYGFGTPTVPIAVHSGSYVDHVDREKLCVLTNEATDTLHKFDPTMNYVVGGAVKRGTHNPLMFTRAKEMGLRTARIPFELYCQFRYNKNVPLDRMTQILLEFKVSGDWGRAFQFLERHKLK